MKKKVRKIIVNDEEYAWNVVGSDYDGIEIKIWKDRKLIFSYCDYNSFNVTPDIISKLIKAKNDEERKEIMRWFSLCDDEKNLGNCREFYKR